MTDTIVLSFRGRNILSGAQSEAARLNCTPKQLCAALLLTVFEEGLVDSVLDGDDPRTIFPDRAPRGQRQAELLDWLSVEIAKTGTGSTTLSYSQISQAIGWEIPHVGRVAAELHKQGFIVRSRSGDGYRDATVWSLGDEVASC